VEVVRKRQNDSNERIIAIQLSKGSFYLDVVEMHYILFPSNSFTKYCAMDMVILAILKIKANS